MDMKELLNNATPEQKIKAFDCKSTEELFRFAKNEGMELSAEDAAELFSVINGKSGEISDDDLDNVAGGGLKDGSGEEYCEHCHQGVTPLVPAGYKELKDFTRYFYECPRCGTRTFENVYPNK